MSTDPIESAEGAENDSELVESEATPTEPAGPQVRAGGHQVGMALELEP
ncbi:hypothetical protein [Nocardia sp. NPDC051832]